MKKLLLGLLLLPSIGLCGTLELDGSGTGSLVVTTAINSLAPGSSNYIQNTASLQSGATFYTSSGTVTNFNIPPSGSLNSNSPITLHKSASITLNNPSDNAGATLTGNGTSGNSELDVVATNGIVLTGPMSVSTSLTVSSNTILTGATFYQNGPIYIGNSAQSVSFSSNVVMSGTTIYAGTPQYHLVTDTASITQINNSIMRYRRPRLIYVSGIEVDVESGTVGTNGGLNVGGSSITIVFPDGAVYTSTGIETSQGVISSTANWGNGGLKGGMAPNENQTNNTWEGFYMVKSTATGDTTHMVVVISSFMPTQANYLTLNTKFCAAGTANCWVYLGVVPNGDGGSSNGNGLLNFTMVGNNIMLRNSLSADIHVNTTNGIALATSASASAATWTYSQGTAVPTSVPPQIVRGTIHGAASASSSIALTDAGASFVLASENGISASTNMLEVSDWPLTMGARTGLTGSAPVDLMLSAYSDYILGVGSNPQL